MLDETILEELDFAIENGCDGEFLTEVKKGYTDLYNRWCECLQRERDTNARLRCFTGIIKMRWMRYES